MKQRDVYRMMRKFYDYDINEVLILDYLVPRGRVDITYSNLARIIGKDVSNTRSAALSLQERGIINIVGEPMKSCYLVSGWMKRILDDFV